MAPVSARAKKIASFDEKPTKDYDPEAEGDASTEDGSDSEQEHEDAAATEHYVSVGKSKLRQKEAPALGPKYSGVRVSRSALDDSDDGMPGDEEDFEDAEDPEDSQEYDDPDTADLERDNIIDDEEIDSDEAFDEGEEAMFRKKGFSFKDSKKATNGSKALNGRSKRAVAADFMSGSDEEEEDDEDLESDSAEDDESAQLDGSETEEGPSDEEDGSSAEEEGSDDDSDEDDDDDDDDDEDDEDEEMGGTDTKDDRSGIRSLMQEGQKSVVATISQAAKADAEKGVAVRQQRRNYDALLNLRIRLQKGLVAVNSFGEVADDDSEDKEPYEAAEEAAIKLWTAIDGFRASLLPEQKAGQKRKRDIDAATSNEAIWEDMQATEERASAKRKKVLDKWSNRVKSTTTTMNKTRQLGAAAGSQSLISVLEDQLVNSDRLVKRTHVPRSCAPVQAGRKMAEDPEIYDDADFYQLLLKELVDQRTSDTAAGGDASVPTVRWTAIKEAKTRKQVDRRASKGRKLRFTVHEKLQNFMAPEDRRSWEEEAIDRLFGTLFGQKMQLKEDVSEDEEDDLAAEEEGLKLFRS
ncbi:hypothetical protein VMCG_03049 [Cytospora schulzeri]|uniref:Protein BFR2 n=1 Tax=Cytospora schulzeri TaxID=448051 RepID=A0A423WYC7_9PEZI|nr:hypothetical protein VMCG_03049 [Valsa malicola]